ncbi:DUF86 domain-containing protein [Candidatus Poribacteria bacterium]|nr:DUF86 domain-containing protein [Candidatus Poribacteria bacterium]
MKEELKQRLLKHIDFMEVELRDYPKFEHLTWDNYSTDIDRRRNVERWIENIINSSIDISKVILTLENISLPDNYKDIVLLISTIKELNIDKAEIISRWVKIRNIISHEYLDIRWSSIKKFISETEPLYKDFLLKTKTYLGKKINEDKDTNTPT